MPIYEYHCQRCGKRVEVLLPSRTATPACPHCGAVLRDRLFSAPSLLKGPASRPGGETCCGREERCDAPPCSSGGSCRRG
jgi:putative FmdB family regulatory protein